MGVNLSQMFPPKPALTEENLPSQAGKVFIVTGGYSGVGLELVTLLFYAGAKVYIAGRSEDKAQQAIKAIKSTTPSTVSPGQIEFLHLELDDLTTIKASVEGFKSKESRLDVLWNNAGVSQPPPGSVSKQGYELQMATNCLGPYLFTQLLLPCLQATAENSPPGSVRVVWTSSQMIDLAAPRGGFAMTDVTFPPKDPTQRYTNTKTGNWLLAHELAREVGSKGILSVTQNPGNLVTNILRTAPKWMYIISRPLLHDAKFGGYTELWAGLSPEITLEMNGAYVIPWGRVHPAPRQDLLDAMKSEEEGGTGLAGKFQEWCENQTADYRQ